MEHKNSTTQRLLETAARRIVSVAIIGVPWLIGGAEAWAFLLFCNVVGAAGILWLLSMLCGEPRLIRDPLTTLCLGALVLFVVLQMIPLPKAVVQSASYYGASQVTATREAFTNIAPPRDLIKHIDLANVPYTFSVSPAATSRSLFLWVAYLLCFLVLANTIHGWDELHRLGMAIVINATFMALIGIVHKFSGSSDILWVHTPRYGGEIFGPFTNRNHFAAYMNLNLGVALGLLFSSKPFVEMMNWPDWRDRLSWFSSRSASAVALMGFSVFLIAGSVCISQSRGAILSMGVAMIFFGFYVAWLRRDMGRTRIAMLAASFLVAAAVLWLGRGQVVSRLVSLSDVAADPMKDLRVVVTLDTLNIFFAFPWMGAGFGTFRHIFSAFQTPSLDLRWLHAHNDWAQLLAEGGLIATAIFITACLAWTLGIHKQLRNCANRARLMVTGMTVGFATIAMHSCIDYSLHKPAVAALLAGMGGVAVAAGHLRSRRIVLDTDEDDHVIRPLGPATLRIIALAGILGIAVLMNAKRDDFRSELAYTRFKYLERISEDTTTETDAKNLAGRGLGEAEMIVLHGRSNPDSLTEMSRDLVQWTLNPQLDRPFRMRQSAAAASGAALAAYAAPTDYLTWLSLARTLMATGYWDQSDASLQRARQVVRNADEVRMFDVKKVPDGKDWEDVRRLGPKERRLKEKK